MDLYIDSLHFDLYRSVVWFVDSLSYIGMLVWIWIILICQTWTCPIETLVSLSKKESVLLQLWVHAHSAWIGDVISMIVIGELLNPNHIHFFFEFRSHLRLSSLKSKSPSFCLDFLASNHGKFHPKSFSCCSHDLGTLLDGVALVTTTMVFCWKAAKSIHFTCGMARVQSFEQEERLHSSKCCRCLLCHTDRQHRNGSIHDWWSNRSRSFRLWWGRFCRLGRCDRRLSNLEHWSRWISIWYNLGWLLGNHQRVWS